MTYREAVIKYRSEIDNFNGYNAWERMPERMSRKEASIYYSKKIKRVFARLGYFEMKERYIMSKEELLAKIKEIAEMGDYELYEFGKKVAMSGLNDKAKYYLYKAIDRRKMELKNSQSVMAVNGEIRDGEI